MDGRHVEFVPVSVVAVLCRDRDRLGRLLYRPMVKGLVGGSQVNVFPLECGCELSPVEAKALGEKWCQVYVINQELAEDSSNGGCR